MRLRAKARKNIYRWPIFVGAAAMLILGGARISEAAKCYEDFLETVSEDGDILIMGSGTVWQVQAGDEIDSALWLPSDDVLICAEGDDALIINVDEQGEKVRAERLR